MRLYACVRSSSLRAADDLGVGLPSGDNDGRGAVLWCRSTARACSPPWTRSSLLRFFMTPANHPPFSTPLPPKDVYCRPLPFLLLPLSSPRTQPVSPPCLSSGLSLLLLPAVSSGPPAPPSLPLCEQAAFALLSLNKPIGSPLHDQAPHSLPCAPHRLSTALPTFSAVLPRKLVARPAPLACDIILSGNRPPPPPPPLPSPSSPASVFPLTPPCYLSLFLFPDARRST
jgi:hypothetical protein